MKPATYCWVQTCEGLAIHPEGVTILLHATATEISSSYVGHLSFLILNFSKGFQVSPEGIQNVYKAIIKVFYKVTIELSNRLLIVLANGSSRVSKSILYTSKLTVITD